MGTEFYDLTIDAGILIDGAVVSAHIKIFRIKDQPNYVCIRSELYFAMKEARLTGFVVHPLA